MKTKSLITIGLGLLALHGSIFAQQNYYHFDGAGLNDHGYGNEVIASVNGGIGEVVCGAAFTATNVPASFIAKYDAAGNPIWHRFYRLNAPAAGNINEAVAVVEATTTAVQGYGLLCYTNAAPAQTVLIKTDLLGNFIWKREIGPLRGASVAYDAALQRFLCLTQVFLNNTNQVHLVVVNANTGVVLFNRVFDGCGNDDTPVTVIHDVVANEYVCLGNSRSVTDNQILVGKVTPANVLVYTRIFGDPTRREIPVDFLRNPAVGNYTIGGYIANAVNTPFFATLDIPGAVANIIPCGGLIGNNTPRRMALINNLYMMVGSQVNAGNINGFFISMTVGGAPANYRIYGQPPAAGSEELRDISQSTILATPTLMCGTHQRTVAWLGSAAGLSYNWLVFANNVGAGTCPQNFVYTLGSYAPPVTNCLFTEFILSPTLIAQSMTSQLATPLNECLFPNISQPDPTPDQDKPISSGDLGPNRSALDASGVSAQVYPNPASAELNVAFTLAKGQTAVMELFDMTGRVVRTEHLNDQASLLVISVSEFPEGVYFCRIRSASAIITEQKIVIAR